jgi:hypothetical protein
VIDHAAGAAIGSLVNLCFLANKQLTMYYASLAQSLAERGHRIFWLSPSRRWTLWLLDHGFATASILSLPDFGREWQAMPEAESRAELADLEGPGIPTIGGAILMDRALRRKPEAYALGFLAVCRRRIEPFLAVNHIDLCIGEATWAWEVLVWMIGRRLGLRMLLPNTVRIPSERFAFFDSLTHGIPTLREPEEPDRRWAEKFLAEYRSRPRPPDYMRAIVGAFAFRREWLKELKVTLLEPGLNRYDESLWPMSYRIRYRAGRAVNAAMIKLFDPFTTAAKRGEARYVLLCLHTQPEASIDVYASLHANQEHTIERLARLMPVTHQLWVKEHPTGLGDRSLGALHRLARLPGVRLIAPGESTFELIRQADLVIAATGTVAYEAALLGQRAATLTPVFFNPIMSVDAARCPDPLLWPLRDLLVPAIERDSAWDGKIVEFLAWLRAQSFAGMPYDSIAQRMFKIGRDDSTDKVLAGFDVLLAWPHLRLAAGRPGSIVKVRATNAATAVSAF